MNTSSNSFIWSLATKTKPKYANEQEQIVLGTHTVIHIEDIHQTGKHNGTC